MVQRRPLFGEKLTRRLTRISTDVPEALVKELDQAWPGWFSSRAEAIREGIRLVLDMVRLFESQSQAPRASA